MDSLTYFMSKLDPEDAARLNQDITTLTGLLEYGNREFPERTAFSWAEGKRTYAQFYDDVARARAYIAGLSLAPGAHIGVLARNSYDFVRLFFAAVTAGYAALLLPVQLPAEAIMGSARKYGVSALFYEDDYAPTIDGIKDKLPDVKFAPASQVTADAAAPMAQLDKTAAAAILFSGGTTGRPKGAQLSHGALMRGALNGAYVIGKTFFQKYLALIPFTHVFGLVRSLLTAMLTGSEVFLCPSMMKDMFRDLAMQKPTILVLVPALAELMLKIASTQGIGALGGELKTIICGGAPVSPDLPAKFDALGIVISPGYGLTETANLVSGNGDPLTKPSSVGFPYPAQELKLVDGELWIRGEHMMDCYVGDPDENAAAFEDGWFKTGDLAKFDSDGFMYITGRIKNIIIAENGENVSPEELEAIINALPFVRDSLVYEDKNQFGKTVIAAQVLLYDEARQKIGEDNVEAVVQGAMAQINGKLPPFMQIFKTTVRKEDFPRSGSMKILRNQK